MSDSYFGRQQYVIYCSQLRATPSADCNISHIAVGLSSYLIHSNHHMRIHTAGVQCMRENPERFIESNTENSWLRYLNNMCTQDTWADALIIQAVADSLKVTIQ